MKERNSALLYAIVGVIIIIGVLSTIIIMVFKGVSITQPLPPPIALVLLLPLVFYYLIALWKFEKMRKKKIYGED